MLKFPSRVESVAVKCGGPVDRPAQVISDVRSYYDNGGFGVGPTVGNLTKTEGVASYTNGTPQYVTVSSGSYDAYGRGVTATDAAGNTTTTTYTPSTGLPTTVSVTGPPVKPGDASTAITTSTIYDPAWNAPITTFDGANKRTDLDYDALGRVTAVWLPNTSKAAQNTPNYAYTYQVTKDAAVAVRAQTIRPDSSQTSSYQLYDGFLRPRQNQEPGPNGGRLITDTFYNAQGKTARTYAAYYADGAPQAALFGVTQPGAVESQTAYDYDGLGRVIAERLIVGSGDGQEKWRTTTTYSGDRVTVDPPTGATPTTTITDARGQTTEVRQYHSDSPTGAYDATTYTYTPAGKPATVTDSSGNTWTHEYDLRGREFRTTDPDKGTTLTGHDDLGKVTSTEDARGNKLFYSYDPIGRKTFEREGSETGPVLTSWVYDTVRKGQLTSVTRTIGGADYVNHIDAYDNLNNVIRATTIVPSVKGEEGLAGSYQFNTRYNLDGTVQSTSLPPAGGLLAEVVAHTYDDLRRPITTTGTTSYVTNTTYSPTGKPQQYEYSTGGKRTWLTYGYEYGTQRLVESRTDRENIAGVDRDAVYTHDDAGDVTTVTDTSRSGTDTQCFSYDYLRRLSEAWTPAGACTATPDPSTVLGGPAPYWTSYTYDSTGNRTQETQHYGGATTRTYSYPQPGQGQHRLSSVTQNGAAGERTDTFGYDAAGNTTSRKIGTTTDQTLTWDSENHLASVTDASGTTSYAYDAEGRRLLRRTPNTTTLYLPDMELTLTKSTGGASATRYYNHGGAFVATRTASGVSFLSADPHGTAELSIDAGTQAISQRRFDPFGNPRGTATGTWPNDKGFVGGTVDPSGLTHLGAREYDSAIGRFISVDPVFDPKDPQSWNGYAYSNSNPTTMSDPSGLRVCEGKTGDNACGSNQRPDGKDIRHTGGSSGSSNSGSWGGCGRSCQSAIRQVVNKFRMGTIHRALAQQLVIYILTLYGVTGCGSRGSQSSGAQAACQQRAGKNSGLNWVGLGFMWSLGKGNSLIFHGNDHLTRQLSRSPNVNSAADMLLDQAFNKNLPLSELGGKHDYVDGKGLGKAWQFVKDVLGMATNGLNGSPIPDAFFGSYNLVYQVLSVNKSSHSITVAFAAYNDTGTASLTHATPDVPRGNPLASVHQRYFWTQTFTQAPEIPDPPMGYGGD
jgi:RHS repeat-associated protein